MARRARVSHLACEPNDQARPQPERASRTGVMYSAIRQHHYCHSLTTAVRHGEIARADSAVHGLNASYAIHLLSKSSGTPCRIADLDLSLVRQPIRDYVSLAHALPGSDERSTLRQTVSIRG